MLDSETLEFCYEHTCVGLKHNEVLCSAQNQSANANLLTPLTCTARTASAYTHELRYRVKCQVFKNKTPDSLGSACYKVRGKLLFTKRSL